MTETTDYEELKLACKKQDEERINFLLENRNLKIEWGLFTDVCRLGNSNIVKLFFDSGYDGETDTAFNYACRTNQIEVAKTILDSDKSCSKYTGLEESCLQGNTEIARMILDSGYWTNNITNLANSVKHPDTLKLLLDKSCDPDKRDSILHSACYEGAYESVKLLLERGYNPNNDNAFYVSCIKSRDDLVRLLIESGYNLESTTEFLVYKILRYCKNTEQCKYNTIKILLESGYKIRDRESALSLYITSGKRRYNIAKLLFEYNCKPDTSSFSRACQRGFTNIVELFILKGYKEKNEEALKLACENNHPEVVKLILENNPDMSTSVKSIYPGKIISLFFEYGDGELLYKHLETLDEISRNKILSKRPVYLNKKTAISFKN